MKQKPEPRQNNRPESGASELVGGVLMITVVVVAISIITVVLFSQPTPAKIPNVNFMTGTNAANTELYLYHNGGDNLRRGEFAVVIDDGPPRTDYVVSDGSDEWSLGKSLILGVTGAPQRVSLVYYESSGGTVLLRSASSNVAELQRSINPSDTPVIPRSSSGGGDAICADLNMSSCLVTALVENLTAYRINLYKDSTANLATGSAISLRVQDTTGKSMIVYHKGSADTLVKLNNTDIITIRTRTQTKNIKAFGIAPQIWELAVDQADLTITRNPPISTISESGVTVIHTWLEGYALSSSSLSFAPSGSSITALTVNSTRYLPVPPAVTDSRTITVTNAKPLPVGLFVLMVDDSQHSVYLVGTADEICIGTNCGPYGL